MDNVNKLEMVHHYPLNTEGRDFAVGDIHGYFKVLDTLLEEVGFDKTKDRLFSVGDLVDRGPDSAKFHEYIYQNWFHAVRGNHEVLTIQSEHDNGLRVQNGGQWFVNEWIDAQRAIRLHLGTLPVAIDIQTKHGLIGIVHANVPFDDWDKFTSSLGEEFDPRIVQFATWDRSRWRASAGYSSVVDNVDNVIVGHCAHEEVVTSENVIGIDTGCGYRGGKLTLWSIDDWNVAAQGTYEYQPVCAPSNGGW
jgi:serine/threonine protein phosphatase 1